MSLTRELVEARLNDLQARLASAVNQRDEAAQLVFALSGAIQDAQWFLSQFPPELAVVPDEPEQNNE